MDISFPSVLSGYIGAIKMSEESQTDYVSYKKYAFIWLLLLVLLGLTIAVVKLNLLEQYSVTGSIFIASVKAGLVLMYFMHLKSEGWLIKGMLLLAVGTLTLIIALTFSDVWYR
jgi:cytochrome c oxidase subunit 4